MYGNKLSRSDGQAMVEFALALPVVALLIFGVLQFGRAFQIKIVLENAAREGAYYFIYDQEDADAGFPNTMAAVRTESQNSGVTIEDSQITVQCRVGGSVNTPPDDCPQGSTVEVIVTHSYEVAVISYFSGPIAMKSNARMLIP